MKRPGFTVEDVIGRNFDANHLTICWDSTFGEYGIFFICSGALEMIPANQIKEIRFSKEGPTYCNECDNPIPERGSA